MFSADGSPLNSDSLLDPKMAGLVRRKAQALSKSRGFSRSDQSDIEQEFWLLLLQRAALFDPARAKAITFASRIIDNKSKSMIRAARTKRSGFGCTVSLHEVLGHEIGKPVNIEATLDDSAARRHTGQRERSEDELTQLRMDIADANASLAQPAKDMAALMSHVSEFAAAEVLGISRRKAAELVETLREVYADRGLSA